MNKSALLELIERSKKNDNRAFRKIVEEYQYMVYTLSFRLLCNEEEARDTVQDTFVKVWLNLNKYNANNKFSTWLYTIVTNLCLDKLKKLKNNFQQNSNDVALLNLVSSENIEQNLINSELGEIISSLTNELTPKQKVVFTLRFLEELEVEEIVIITGLSAEKIKSNLYLARQTIRQKLEKY
jgi:RNA polymerase sigma-70 factor, ECF subfamily